MSTHSAPAFIRDARTYAPLPRLKVDLAPRASPDGTAVSAVNLIAALTAGPAPDASTAERH